MDQDHKRFLTQKHATSPMQARYTPRNEQGIYRTGTPAGTFENSLAGSHTLYAVR
jgi:hypothetical protein